MTFDLPILNDEDWKSLYRNSGVTGWLIRLRKKSTVRNKVLGYFAVEMISPKPGSETIFRIQSSKTASLGVYYAASSISSRLDHLPCPAFDHRLLIDEIEVSKSPVGKVLWATSPSDQQTINAKVDLISYSAITINGGMSLMGDYYVDLALYNPKTKNRMSSYMELANFVSVKKEKTKIIKGCENYVVPDQEDQNSVKKFKFGS